MLGHEVAGRIAAVGAGVTGSRSGTRSPSTRPSWSATGACPSGSPAAPTSTRGSATSARRRSTRTPTAGSASCGWSAPTRSARCPRASSTEHGALAEPLAVALHAVQPGRRPARPRRLVNGAGPIGSLVVAAAKYRGAATVVAADIADASLAVAKAMGADEVRNLAAGDTLPEDAELVFEASGAPAALGGRPARDRPRRHARPGRQPARHRRCRRCSATWSPGRSPGSGRTGSSRRSATRCAAMRDGLDVSPLITHRFGLDQAERGAGRRRGPDQRAAARSCCGSATVSTDDAVGSVVTVGETMALLDAPASGRLGSGSALPVGIGGAESNVAIGLARLGVDCTWVSRVGDDALGTFLTREIRAEGVRVIATATRRRRPG